VAVVGERKRAVLLARDVAVLLEAAHHLVNGWRRDLHRARHVRAGDGQARLLEPEDRLEVLLLGGRGLLAGHDLIVSSPGCGSAAETAHQAAARASGEGPPRRRRLA